MATALSSILKGFLSCFILLILLTPGLGFGQTAGPVLSVDRLIEEAALSNPEILEAKKKWEAFKEKVPQTRALPDPMLGFGIISLPTNFSFRDEDMTMKELYSTEIIPLAELQVSSAMSAYRVGKVDFLTPLESQMSLYRIELEYHQAITEYERSLANLEAAVGKPVQRR